MTSPQTRSIVIDVLNRPITMTAPAHYIVPRSLQRGGLASHEPETLACALALCELRQGVFLDIGANVGIFSIVVGAMLDRECHAFEPTPEMADVIRTVARNHELRINVHQIALSHHSGQETLYLSAKSDSSNSLNRRFRPHSGTLEVAVRRLDDFSIESPAVLKIDTESTEPDVLDGGENLIRAHRPAIICEALPGRTETRLNQFLEQHDYVAYHITPKLDWHMRSEIVPDGSKHYNWLFAPSAPTDDVWHRIAHWQQAIMAQASS